MKWFGESWGAPICDPKYHWLTPTGRPCLGCGKPIADGDQGFMVPNHGAEERAPLYADPVAVENPRGAGWVEGVVTALPVEGDRHRKYRVVVDIDGEGAGGRGEIWDIGAVHLRTVNHEPWHHECFVSLFRSCPGCPNCKPELKDV